MVVAGGGGDAVLPLPLLHPPDPTIAAVTKESGKNLPNRDRRQMTNPLRKTISRCPNFAPAPEMAGDSAPSYRLRVTTNSDQVVTLWPQFLNVQ